MAGIDGPRSWWVSASGLPTGIIRPCHCNSPGFATSLTYQLVRGPYVSGTMKLSSCCTTRTGVAYRRPERRPVTWMTAKMLCRRPARPTVLTKRLARRLLRMRCMFCACVPVSTCNAVPGPTAAGSTTRTHSGSHSCNPISHVGNSRPPRATANASSAHHPSDTVAAQPETRKRRRRSRRKTPRSPMPTAPPPRTAETARSRRHVRPDPPTTAAPHAAVRSRPPPPATPGRGHRHPQSSTCVRLRPRTNTTNRCPTTVVGRRRRHPAPANFAIEPAAWRVIRRRLQKPAHRRRRNPGLLRDRRNRLPAQPHRLQRLTGVHPMLLTPRLRICAHLLQAITLPVIHAVEFRRLHHKRRQITHIRARQALLKAQVAAAEERKRREIPHYSPDILVGPPVSGGALRPSDSRVLRLHPAARDAVLSCGLRRRGGHRRYEQPFECYWLPPAPHPNYQRLHQIPGSDWTPYPIIGAYHLRTAGVGVRQRGGAAVCQITTGSTYTPPTPEAIPV